MTIRGHYRRLNFVIQHDRSWSSSMTKYSLQHDDALSNLCCGSDIIVLFIYLILNQRTVRCIV